MAIPDTIHRHVQELPESLQAEVLDFVEYLLAKSRDREDRDWSDGSLALAMRGMEGEAGPLYTDADVKVTFP